MTTTLTLPKLADSVADFNLPEFPQPSVKEPHTRLLDLLAGWVNFISDDGYPDAEGIVDEVCDLYQRAGAMDDDSPEAVRAFVTERVLPTLLRRA